MKIMKGSIVDVSGPCFVIQQVNCQGAYGAGVSGVISTKWPEVEAKYRAHCKGTSPDDLFDTALSVPCHDDEGNVLTVVNLFTQKRYGNSAKTGEVYTDMNSLVDWLAHYDSLGIPVYVPYRIGCGLAGGNWTELTQRLANCKNIVTLNPNL